MDTFTSDSITYDSTKIEDKIHNNNINNITINNNNNNKLQLN